MTGGNRQYSCVIYDNYDTDNNNLYLRPKAYLYLIVFLMIPAWELCLAQQNGLWPLPQKMNTSSDNILQFIPISFDFVTIGHSCDILDAAFRRWWHRTLPHKCCNQQQQSLKSSQQKLPILKGLNVNVKEPCSEIYYYPSLESNESYELEISSASSTLAANSVWGVLHGLETFSQLIYQNHNKIFVINETSIVDFPRFKHRGLLLDTSRHFLSKELILQNLDVMAQNKLNVFHWHIVDDTSFPYQSSSFPLLSEKGAFDPVTHIYTQNDVREIIEKGRLLGIRVIPEYDSPGHTKSWGAAFKDLLTICYEPLGYFPTGQYGPMNPITEFTYNFMETLFKEIASVFPDPYIHIGGDEVDYECWKSNSNIVNFMNKMRFNMDFRKLEEYYIKRIINIIKDLEKNCIVWQEVFDNDAKLPKDTVIQVWKEDHKYELAKVTSMGYKTLLSSCWYLNYISYGSDWHKYYMCDPHDFPGSEKQKALVIGGEACMWGEYVDSTNLMSRLWPRASVVAERLWSSKQVKDYTDANRRLIHHRCRLVRRGIPAQPISGPGFCSIEWKTDDINNPSLANHYRSGKIISSLLYTFILTYFS